MTAALLGSLVVFSFTTAVSPGPNNTMLLTIGAHRGVRGALPYLAGMAVGLGSMMFVVSLGLGALFSRYPEVYQVLKFVGFGYVLYLAWRVARAGAPGSGEIDSVPARFPQATLFQWVNPKAWIVIATIASAFVPAERGFFDIALATLVFLVATLPGAIVWAITGGLLAKLLTTPRSRKVFTVTMAIALVASMIPVLLID